MLYNFIKISVIDCVTYAKRPDKNIRRAKTDTRGTLEDVFHSLSAGNAFKSLDMDNNIFKIYKFIKHPVTDDYILLIIIWH